ncbi:MAG: hypothetical protein LBQ60_20930 [Bacteroidales bacterium]|nr:hypothetical protein [Bacteroidales bacterium]
MKRTVVSDHSSHVMEEVIGDITFEKGFSLSPLDPQITQRKGADKANTDTLYFYQPDTRPVWQMSQWYSKYDLAGTITQKNRDSISYSNQGKKITRHHDGSLLLEITTSTEYDHPRRDGEPWPHLLIEQKLNKRVNIGEVRKILFSMEMKLVKCTNMMREEDFNEALHTAQTPLYFILKNTNKNSEDYNSAIWFGIPSFDYRYTKMSEKELISWDIGTQMFIYNVPQILVWGDISFQDMRWHKAETDLLPLMMRAVESMQEKGVFTATSLSDLVLTEMNFGWEVPGIFDAAVMVRGISLKVERDTPDTMMTASRSGFR